MLESKIPSGVSVFNYLEGDYTSTEVNEGEVSGYDWSDMFNGVDKQVEVNKRRGNRMARPKKAWIDKDRVFDLYITKGKSILECSVICSCGFQTFRNNIVHHGITPRKKGYKYNANFTK